MADETKDVSLISKITIKAVGANPKEAIKQEKEVKLVAIYGSANDIKQVENKINGGFDDALLGMFEAVNLQTGETFRAGKLFLPKIAQQLVVAEVKRLTEQGGSVDFGFEVGAKPSDSAIGYEYTVRSLFKPVEADPLEKMRSEVMKNVKSLPAPKQEAAKSAKK